MQIRSDYSGLSGREYQDSNLPKYKGGSSEEKELEGTARQTSQSTSSNRGSSVRYSFDGDSYQSSRVMKRKSEIPTKKETSFMSRMKQFWNALGEEGTREEIESKTSLLGRFQEIIATVLEKVKGITLELPEQIRTRIQKVLGVELKGLKKEQESFGAFAGGQSMSEEDKREQGTKQIQKEESQMTGRMLRHSHLMDSYNKQGTYTRLGDQSMIPPGSIDKKG